MQYYICLNYKNKAATREEEKRLFDNERKYLEIEGYNILDMEDSEYIDLQINMPRELRKGDLLLFNYGYVIENITHCFTDGAYSDTYFTANIQINDPASTHKN